MIRCVDEIREQVRRETGLSLTDAQIENMLAGQPCTVSEAVRDIVNQQGRKYTEHEQGVITADDLRNNLHKLLEFMLKLD